MRENGKGRGGMSAPRPVGKRRGRGRSWRACPRPDEIRSDRLLRDRHDIRIGRHARAASSRGTESAESPQHDGLRYHIIISSRVRVDGRLGMIALRTTFGQRTGGQLVIPRSGATRDLL